MSDDKVDLPAGENPPGWRPEWKRKQKRSLRRDRQILNSMRGGKAGDDGVVAPVPESVRGGKRPVAQYVEEPDVEERDIAEVLGLDADAPVRNDAGADGDVADVADSDDVGDVDDIAWNREELKRLRELKRQVSDEYLALSQADKDVQAFYDKKIKMIESQEAACVKVLTLFNKKRLEAGASANVVEFRIVPWSGDGTGAVKTWL